MLNSYQESYSLLYFSDSFKLVTEQLTTNAHYNKKGDKYPFTIEDDDPFQCSFDQRRQKGHAQAIWDASLHYVQSALLNQDSCSKGFNDYQQIYDYRQDQNSILGRNSFDYIILRNEMMTTEEQHGFIRILKNESELMQLVQELQTMFYGSVFQEITYLIYKICEKRKELLQNPKTHTNSTFTLPPVKCFLNLQNLHPHTNLPLSPFEETKTYEQVIFQALQCSNEIGNQMYYDRRLKIINLRECKKECRPEDQIRQLFLSFYGVLTERVYLSLEGFFSEGELEPKMFLNIDSCEDLESDFDQTNSQSSYQIIPQQNRNARGMEDLQMIEEDSEFYGVGRKKTKLY